MAISRSHSPTPGRRPLRHVGQALLVAGAVLFALPVLAPTASADPVASTGANPDLPAATSCEGGIDITLVLDRSGSMEGFEDTVQGAAQAFVDEFAGTGSRIKVVTFSDRATGYLADGSQTGDTDDIDDIAFRDAADVTIEAFDGNGSTNWDDALELVRRSEQVDGRAGGDLVVFVTDGNPTSRNSGAGGSGGDGAVDDREAGDPHGITEDGSGSSTSDGEVDEAMTEANVLKAQGSHLFAIGVGSGISQTNLARVTQNPADVYTGAPPPTINAADYTLLGDFDQLANAFRSIVTATCGATIDVVKQTDPGGFAQQFPFTLRDSQNAIVGSLTQAHGDAPEAFAPVTPGTYSLTEGAVAGWTLASAGCDDLGTDATETVSPASLTVAPQSHWRCTFVNTPNDGSVTIVKTTTTGNGTFEFPSAKLGAFSLTTVGGTAQKVFAGVAPGTYAVSETAKAGWTVKSATCNDGSPVSAIDVGPGENVTCTFVNEPTPIGLLVTKDANPTSLDEAGGPVTYTVTIKNTSPQSVSIDSIVDTPFAIPGDSSCAALVGTSLAADDGAAGGADETTCTFTATIPYTDAPATVTDTVTVEVSDDAGQKKSASDTADVTITDKAPTATATKSAAPTSVEAPSGNVVFSVSTTNTSAEALTVIDLEDDIPGLGTVDPTTVAGPISATTCSLGTVLPPGGTYSCTFTAAVSGEAGDSVTDTIRFTLVDGEQTQVKPTAQATVAVTGAPDLSVAKTDGGISVDLGDELTYTITYANHGNEGATGVVVTETVPVGTTFVGPDADWSCAPGDPAGTECTHVVGSLGVGDEGTVDFTLLVADELDEEQTDIDNVVSIDDDGEHGDDKDPSDNTDTDDTPVKLLGVTTFTPDCDGDVPYLVYDATTINVEEGATATITWVNPDGDDVVMEDLPLSGRVLWPGAVVDEDGEPLDWPGWTLEADGTWTEGDEFDWVRPSVTVHFQVNPETTVEVAYPPSEPTCLTDPPEVDDEEVPTEVQGEVLTPGALPTTGGSVDRLLIAAGLLTILGGLVLMTESAVTSRRRRSAP